MSYVSRIDNKTFSSREEALNFFEETYLFEQKNEDVATRIIKEVEKVIPENARVVLEAKSENYYQVIVLSNEFKIKCPLNLELSEETRCWNSEFSTIESLVEFFKWSTSTITKILEYVSNTYDFKEFKFERYHDDYGNGSYFDFRYVTNEEEEFYVTYEGDDLDIFLNSFKQHFSESLEGQCNRIKDEGYFVGYSIGGVPIDGMIKRANRLNKKVRLEII